MRKFIMLKKGQTLQTIISLDLGKFTDQTKMDDYTYLIPNSLHVLQLYCSVWFQDQIHHEAQMLSLVL